MESGHKKTATTLRIENSTAFGIMNETIKHKRPKAMNMRYHWLKVRVHQKHFNIYWRPGIDNLGDYHTKHHSAQYQKYMHPLILNKVNILNVLRGYVKLPQPQMCMCKYTQPFQRTPRSTKTRNLQWTLRDTQIRNALESVYDVTI